MEGDNSVFNIPSTHVVTNCTSAVKVKHTQTLDFQSPFGQELSIKNKYLGVKEYEFSEHLNSRSGSSSTPYVGRQGARSSVELSSPLSSEESGITNATFDSILNTPSIKNDIPKFPPLQKFYSTSNLPDTLSSDHNCQGQVDSDSGVDSNGVCQLKCTKCNIMHQIKSVYEDNSFTAEKQKSSHNKRITLANFTQSCGEESGFHELSTTLNSSADSPLMLTDSYQQPRDNFTQLTEYSKSYTTSVQGNHETFRTVLASVMPYEPDRLIGRKVGIKEVDIPSELHSRQIYSCLSLLLSYLPGSALVCFCRVSTSWKAICFEDKQAHQRRTAFLQQGKSKLSGKENYSLARKKSRVQLTSCSASVLTELQQPGSSSLVNCKVTAVKNPLTQREIYLQEAAKLRSDEKLRKCPKCQSPAKINSTEERAICWKECCGFDFCVLCLNDFHGSKPCASCSRKRTDTDTVGTKKSKRNLKRL